MREYIDLLVKSEEAHKEAISLGFSDTGFQRVHVLNSLNEKRKGITLYHPESDSDVRKSLGRIDSLLDPIVPGKQIITPTNATLIKERNLIVVFTLKYFLSFSGVQRVRFIRNAILTGRILKKKRIPVVLSSGADTKYDVRTPRQIISFGELFELEYPQCVYGVTELPKYLVNKCEGGL